MDAKPMSTPPVAWSVVKAVAACVVIAGTLDISDALIFYGLRGTPPGLLLRVIASGLLGPSALRLGVPGALLGLSIHYFITCAWATLFILASLRFALLRKNPLVIGPLYGLLIYAVMNYIVLPHTREVGHPTFHLAVFCNGVAALVLCMGLPIALISRRMLRAD
jgi:hypothetical protein